MTRPKVWKGTEAAALAKVAGVPDPEQAMRLLVEDLLDDTEQREAPVDLELVASFRDITGIDRLPMKDAAIITPTERGLRIFVNAHDTPGRQNFSICHEICHTLFPHFLANPVVKDAHTGTFSIKNEEEWLCDFGASRLLLPPPLLKKKALNYEPSIHAVLQLADDFGASIEATAIAWSALDLWPVAVVIFEERLKPKEMWKQQQLALPTMEEEMRVEAELRVSTACVPRSLGIFIPKHMSIGRNGAIYQAFENQNGSSGKDVLHLRRGLVEIDTQSVYAPYRKDGVLQHRVVSLVTPFNLPSGAPTTVGLRRKDERI